MKKIERWQDNKESYILGNGFVLKRADKHEFGIHEAIYSNADLELSFSWRILTSANENSDNLFWIYRDDKRIGGVHIGPNVMSSFFMEVPYIYDRFIVITALNDALSEWSNDEESIKIYGVIPEDIHYFNRLGYRIMRSRRVMIRPTETFDDIDWGKDYMIKVPDINDVLKIGRLFFESYSGGIDYECFGEQNLQEAIESAKYVLNVYRENNTLEGSTLVFDKNTKELVGACLAGINGFCDNGFSEIGEVVVKPEYRNRGIASRMIKRALTNLKRISPATILCVTIGNSSEALYNNLGFFPGIKFTNMVLK